MEKLKIIDLGILDYNKALEYQRGILQRRINEEMSDVLIMVEHPPVVTFGRVHNIDNMIDKSFFSENSIESCMTGRGGSITYHAPGQLVLYPVIDLSNKKKDISFFIELLEKTVCSSLCRLGVNAKIERGRRGVWAGGRKIAFIGIALKRWITYHGVAVNISNDIEPFKMINPCGEADIKVTSAEISAGRKFDMFEVKKIFAEQFNDDLISEYEENLAGV